MCISVTVFPDSTTQYTLTSSGSSALGWIAMSFGATMANSPMPTAGGEFGYVLEQLRVNRRRRQTVLRIYCVLHLAQPFSTAQPVIWALVSVPPSGAASDARLVQHVDSGTFTLDLTLPLSANGHTTPPTTSTSGGDSEHKRNMMIANHGILCTIGALGLLPLGFAGHAVIQAVLSGPIIVAGVALGIHSVDASGGMHLDDTHNKLGVALFMLYFVQLLGGAVIHYFKPKNSMRRPAQNYAHAFLGLLIIALAFWQVRTGYRREYPEWATGRVPMGVNTLWIVSRRRCCCPLTPRHVMSTYLSIFVYRDRLSQLP
ncbi:hypothetical protein FIBSPDRAFT_1038318 [Athelia psychrophila]|uniref:Cytochrome b561 domain-containing protein n=1 Tax=Athelia psychrophila TaxID=1759441 RepID=A0A166T870_9AGAM|nr:hypothetical protein FIBSPDRAFT_1038318 [Fibularhizoctonia sp. CBS 109695]